MGSKLIIYGLDLEMQMYGMPWVFLPWKVGWCALLSA